ncbi:hypothetical protein D9M69_704790 [compost metagenome]
MFGLERHQPVALAVVSGIGRATAAAQAGVTVDQVKVDAHERAGQFQRPIGKTAYIPAIHRHWRIELVGGVFQADADTERLIAAQVSEQGVVLFVRVIAEGDAETAA